MRFPNTVGELLTQLDIIFPEVFPTPQQTHDDILFAGGQRSVVQYIKKWRDGALAGAAAVRPRGEGRPTR